MKECEIIAHKIGNILIDELGIKGRHEITLKDAQMSIFIPLTLALCFILTAEQYNLLKVKKESKDVLIGMIHQLKADIEDPQHLDEQIEKAF